MNVDGSGKERTCTGEGMLSWLTDLSPDGTELLIVKCFGYFYDVYKVNILDGTLTPLAVDSSKIESDAYWSPDGSKIVYQQTNRDSVQHLWLMDSDGSNKQQLGTSYNIVYGKDWSPDGSKIVYCARDGNDKPDLWMIDSDGTNQVQITDTPYREWWPSFSPDGQYIVYVSEEGDTSDLWLRNIDGSYNVRLTYNLGIGDASPHWSPDGRKIVFVGNQVNEHADIAVMTLGKIDPTPGEDSDGDGVLDDKDNCPDTQNPGQDDSDGDGRGDVCDNCKNTPNPDQKDTDEDGLGDACEPNLESLIVDILNPKDDFSIVQSVSEIVKAKVTDNFGNPVSGLTVKATFTNGDVEHTLYDDGAHSDGVANDGIYANEWVPTTVATGYTETACTIRVTATHSSLGSAYGDVNGVIKTEIPLNIDILSPETGFTVNKTIPQLIRVKVTDGSGNVVPGSTITKSEASFSNGDSTILLYDDGAHHDGSADDGIYANVWIPENIDSGNNIDVGIEVNVYSGDIVLASKAVDGVLTPNEYVLLDTVVAYEDDISKSSVISVYYNVSKEDPEQYNLFLEINRKIPEDLDYDPFEMCPQCYPANSFGTISLSIPENVDFVNSLRGTYGLNWTKYREKVPNSDKWPRGSVIPQYFSCKEHYEDITMGIKKPADREKMTADVLSVLNTIIGKIPGYNVPMIFDVSLAGGSYVLETSEDTVFDADLIIGENSVYKEFSELNVRDTIVLNWIDGGDYWEIYESVVTMAPLKFQDTGTHELVVQSFFDLEGKDVLYNKKVSMNIFGVDDENIQPNEQIWGDVKLEEGFEVIDNEIIYNSAMADKPRLSTAISVSRKVNKTDPNKQVLYFEISRKTDPENDHKLVEGGWHLWPDWPEWLMYLWPYLGEPTVPVYIPQSAAYGCLHHNLEDIVFQISFDEDIDIMYNKIKDYEIGQRNFIYHDLYDRLPDGDQLTDDKESFIPQYFEYTDAFLYPETEEGRHYNFYKEVPSVNNWDEQMAVLNLYLSFVPYINWLTTFDTILDLWSNEHGIEFIGNQKPYEEILDINERDLIIRDFLHKRPNDLYESIVSEIPIILNNKPTDVYFTIFFNVGGKGKSGKTAAYSKKITLKNVISLGEQLENIITNTIGMEFVPIPAGEFDMGSPLDEEGMYDNEGPVHHVNIGKAFYMCKYEVTQKQWRAIMGDNPSYFKGDDLPVERVSWVDVQEFIKKLNEKEGTDKYRLPSEAEWEYACRAGTSTRYSLGDSESKLGDYAWYWDNSGGTHPVGQKKANPWGLYDMHGNVREWVQDCWHSDYNGAPTDGSAWVVACKYVGAARVIRGGSWINNAGSCRSAFRIHVVPRGCARYVGFRILKEQ